MFCGVKQVVKRAKTKSPFVDWSNHPETYAKSVIGARRGLIRSAFQPKPLRRVLIPKGKGKLRSLGIPAVRDRIAQEVLRQLHIACLRTFVP